MPSPMRALRGTTPARSRFRSSDASADRTDVGAPRTSTVGRALDKAVAIPSATIHAHVDAVRRRNPGATPEQIVRLLEREYLAVLTTAGGVTGAAAATPGLGTGVGLTLTVSDVAAFFGASAAFTFAVASVHGIEVTDTARRRALLLATILGDEGAATVGDLAGLGPVAFAGALLTRVPTPIVGRVNHTLTRRLVRRQLGRQSALAVGRLVPFGIGAAVGVVGARALGRTVVDGAWLAFGQAPEAFTTSVGTSEVLRTETDPDPTTPDASA